MTGPAVASSAVAEEHGILEVEVADFGKRVAVTIVRVRTDMVERNEVDSEALWSDSRHTAREHTEIVLVSVVDTAVS